MSERQCTHVLGVRIDDITMDEVLHEIAEAIRKNRKLVITPINIRVVMEALRNPKLFEMLTASQINTPDSRQIIFLLRMRKCYLRERVTGADLFANFPGFAGKHGFSIGIFGGLPHATQSAKRRIEQEYHVGVPFAYSPAPAEIQETPQTIIQKINDAKPDVLFVALGCPKQEIWIATHREKLNVSVFVCIGAGIDFFAGVQRRAPYWMQRAGLEWMARLFGNPKKMALRYLNEARFYWHFLIETLKLKG